MLLILLTTKVDTKIGRQKLKTQLARGGLNQLASTKDSTVPMSCVCVSALLGCATERPEVAPTRRPRDTSAEPIKSRSNWRSAALIHHQLVWSRWMTSWRLEGWRCVESGSNFMPDSNSDSDSDSDSSEEQEHRQKPRPACRLCESTTQLKTMSDDVWTLCHFSSSCVVPIGRLISLRPIGAAI